MVRSLLNLYLYLSLSLQSSTTFSFPFLIQRWRASRASVRFLSCFSSSSLEQKIDAFLGLLLVQPEDVLRVGCFSALIAFSSFSGILRMTEGDQWSFSFIWKFSIVPCWWEHELRLSFHVSVHFYPLNCLFGGKTAGVAIDQGIAYGLMLVALVLTYIIHWETRKMQEPDKY